jgi:hypothetical protein
MLDPLQTRKKLKVAWLSLILVLFTLALGGCQADNQIKAPSEDQIRTPAVGTPIPAGAGLSPVTLPDNGSGALFVNNASVKVRVVVSNTIASIDPRKGFLFVLPPGSYQFFIYDLEPTVQVSIEKIDPNKVRYVYLLPPPPPQ